MILCVNLNAAIDKTVIVDRFELGKIHRPEMAKSLAGGKGCNVARGLRTLGEKPVVAGWVGGTAGQFIEQSLHAEGIGTNFVQTGLESRTCLSIVDDETQVITEVYERGEPLPAEKVAEFVAHFKTIIADYDVITLSGSIPPGVPDDIYAQLIQIAKTAGKVVFLDASKQALVHGVQAKPYLIKPNASEIEVLAKKPLHGFVEYAQAAREVSRQYETIVLLSLGGEGAIAAWEEKVWYLKIPKVDVKSAVGSGDCMLAGVVYGYLNGYPFDEMLISGVAAGTANTLQIGAGQFDLRDYEALLGQILISEYLQ